MFVGVAGIQWPSDGGYEGSGADPKGGLQYLVGSLYRPSLSHDGRGVRQRQEMHQ